MKIYTGMGDEGQTGLLNGKRVLKDDERIELVGNIDELTCMLGLAKVNVFDDEKLISEIEEIQKLLILIMADISEGVVISSRVKDNIVNKLEGLIDEYQYKFPPEKQFVIPGDNKISALFDAARATARKAERTLIRVDKEYSISKIEKAYMNRLSDYLYTVARYLDFKEMIKRKVTSIIGEDYKAMKVSEVSTESFQNPARMSLDIAKWLMDIVEKKAAEAGLKLCISAADDKGNLVAVHFMDGTLPASLDISMKKAYTSAALKMSTEELGKLAQPGAPLYGITNANHRVIVFGGGYPLKVNNSVIGALAVSGGTAEQDIEIARFGTQAFEERFSGNKYDIK